MVRIVRGGRDLDASRNDARTTRTPREVRVISKSIAISRLWTTHAAGTGPAKDLA